jgi:putative copper resistance protein D
MSVSFGGKGTFASVAGFLCFCILIFCSAAWAQDHPADNAAHEHDQHDHMSMSSDEMAQMNEGDVAKALADKKESEFNHHLAGIFVILAGLALVVETSLPVRWSFLRYAWPLCFLLAGVYLLVFSDTELWPFGPQSWWYGLTHNPEDLQHKGFAVILLALGFVEFQRARGVLKSLWAKWIFPVAAFCGSVMLLFHEHHPGMHGADHMAVMAKVQAEHLNFAVAGFGIGILKGLSEFPTPWQRLLAKLWPLPIIALGVMLMFYTE